MMPKKHGLGRGLGALIPPNVSTTLASGVREIDIAQIAPNPRQPRHRMDEEELRDLAASLKEHGLIQPVLVTTAPNFSGESPRYLLIAGERRLTAAKLAGLERIPAIVRGATPQQMLEIALVENIQRADLKPLEEAEAYQALMQDFGLTQEEVAAKVGRDRTTVANALRLLKLPSEIQAALADGSITEGHARAILGVTDPSKQHGLLRAVVEHGLSVRQTEETARRLNDKARTPGPKSSERPASRGEGGMPGATSALEEEFRKALGTKVQITRSREGGKIIVYFYSEEELQALYSRMVG